MIWGVVAVVFVLAGMMYFMRKAGTDAAKAQATGEALNEVVAANKPATPAELDSVRKQYRRD